MTAKKNDNAVRDAIAEIRRIITGDNVMYSNDELFETCVELVEADSAARKDAGAATPAGPTNFLASLDAAVHRADSYDENERAMITRAITRANRSMANR